MMKNVHIGWGPVGMTKIQSSTNLKLNNNRISLEEGGSYKLMILSDYEETPVWSSSNTKVATVDDEGNVTVVGFGTTIITVRSGKLQGRCTIVVQAPPVIEPDEPTIPDEPIIPDEPVNKLDNAKIYYGYIPNSEGTIESYSAITEQMLLEAFENGQLQERICEPCEFKVIIPESALAIVLLPNQQYTAKKNQLGNILEFDNEYMDANGLKVGDFYLYGEWNLSTEVEITVNV
jgi:hypothetical protein